MNARVSLRLTLWPCYQLFDYWVYAFTSPYKIYRNGWKQIFGIASLQHAIRTFTRNVECLRVCSLVNSLFFRIIIIFLFFLQKEFIKTEGGVDVMVCLAVILFYYMG